MVLIKFYICNVFDYFGFLTVWFKFRSVMVLNTLDLSWFWLKFGFVMVSINLKNNTHTDVLSTSHQNLQIYFSSPLYITYIIINYICNLI